MTVYLGLGLIACASLMFEVALTRLLSVTTWYHLAFLAISTAMLGMTAGAVTVYLRPSRFEPHRVLSEAGRASLSYGGAVAFALVVLCLVPVMMPFSVMGALSLLVTAAMAALPLYYAGIVVTAMLTKTTMRVGRLYGADLVGAAGGCLLALVCLERLDAPSTVLVSAGIGCAAGACFWTAAGRRWSGRMAFAGALGMVGLGLLNSTSPNGIGPMIVKGALQSRSAFEFERWNSYSRVAFLPRWAGPPQYWGASPKAPADAVYQYQMNIDGEAGTTARRFATTADIDHLRFDVTNFVHYLRPAGNVFIIGVGGGRDMQSAILFGHERVVGVDVNSIFIDLLNGQFKTFAGLSGRPGVELVADEARSHLARHAEKFTVIQMSLIDTWASTGAGAFSLSENGLYTVEAWRLFLSRLDDDGVLTVSRWFSPANIGEAGRMLSLAVASLLDSGVAEPDRHIAMIAANRVATLLVSRRPLNAEETVRLGRQAQDLGFRVIAMPGTPADHPMLRSIIAARSLQDLRGRIADAPLRYDPPTDDSPYFFNMLRLSHLRPGLRVNAGVLQGNMVATYNLLILLLSLALLSVATIVLPLLINARRADKPSGVLWSAAVYFSVIGSGFMFLEIGLVQRLSVFLGHPIYGLGVLLFAIIASAGVGSLLSEWWLPRLRIPLATLPIVMAALIVLGNAGIQGMMAAMAGASTALKILASVAAVFPLGLLLGVFFPAGMRLVREARCAETPWYWALNGVFGVLCSALAVFVSIQLSISANFWLAGACYLSLVPCLRALSRTAPR